MVIGFIALFVALSGTATALRGTSIISKNDFKKGAVDKRALGADSVGKSEAREDGDSGGGFTGDQINEGTLKAVPNAEGVARWAIVNANGDLIRDGGVASSTRTAGGVYQVVFDSDVTGCNAIAGLGRIGTQTPQAGEVGVGFVPGNAKGIAVRTRDSAGGLSDRSFHIAVNC
jgi:hypothetical protein